MIQIPARLGSPYYTCNANSIGDAINPHSPDNILSLSGK